MGDVCRVYENPIHSEKSVFETTMGIAAELFEAGTTKGVGIGGAICLTQVSRQRFKRSTFLRCFWGMVVFVKQSKRRAVTEDGRESCKPLMSLCRCDCHRGSCLLLLLLLASPHAVATRLTLAGAWRGY